MIFVILSELILVLGVLGCNFEVMCLISLAITSILNLSAAKPSAALIFCCVHLFFGLGIEHI